MRGKQLGVVSSVAMAVAVTALAESAVFRPPQFYDAGDVLIPPELAYSCLPFDWDRDGIMDLLVARNSTDTILVLLNNHEGVFASRVSYPTPLRPGTMATARLNSDPWPDLVVGSLDGGHVAIYLTESNGLLQPTVITYGGAISSFGFIDCDSDGDLDIVLTQSNYGVRMIRNDGTGGFVAAAEWSIGGDVAQLAVCNVNNDLHSDIVIATSSESAPLLLGDGAGAFSPAPWIPVGSPLVSIISNDFNGDGIDDLAASRWDGTVTMLLGSGAGTFTPSTSVPAGPLNNRLVAADIDQDDALDIVAGSDWYTFSVLFGDGTGQLSRAIIECGSTPRWPVVEDFDSNGYPDVAVGLSATDSIAVFLNASGGITPVVIARIKDEYRDGRLYLEWTTGNGRPLLASVYRHEGASWMMKGHAQDTRGVIRWIDSDVKPGGTYTYRLGVMDDTIEMFVGEITVLVPGVVAFDLTIVNPAIHRIITKCTFGATGPAKLSVSDISGRVVAALDLDVQEPGQLTAEILAPSNAPPGVYVVRLQQGGLSTARRVSLIR